MKLNKLALTFLLAMGINTAQASLVDQLKPAKIEERIRTEIADLEVNFGVNLFDVDLFEGLGISARYRYEVEPSHNADLHTRVDRWRVKADLKVGDLLADSLDTPLYLNIKRDSEIFFVRQFESKKKALTALPYTLKRLPLNAKRALKELKPGDFVSLPAKMSVAIGASASTNHAGAIAGASADANIFYILSGQFNVQIYRMKDNQVRLKLIAQRQRGTGVSAEIGGDLTVVGVKIVDKVVNKIFDLDLAELEVNKTKGNQFILDYVFDLDYPEAKKAYNNILSSTYKFKDLAIMREFVRERELDQRLLSTYELAEEVFEKDKNLVTEKRVDRIFKGFNDFDRSASKLKLGLILASFKKDRSFTENQISYETKDGNRKHFFYPHYSSTTRTRLGLSFLGSKGRTTKSIFGLVPTDAKGKDIGAAFSDLGFTYERKDKIFRQDEQASFVQFLNNNLPADLFDNIDFRGWTEKYKAKKDSNVFFRLILKESAFQSIKKLSRKELVEKLIDFHKEREEIEAGFIHTTFEVIWEHLSIQAFTERGRLKRLGKKFHKALTRDITGKERLERLMDLRRDYLFSKIGFGFILSLVDQDSLEDHISMTLTMQADDTEKVEVEFGNQELSELYFELQHAHNAINNRSFDLRLTEEELRFRDRENLQAE